MLKVSSFFKIDFHYPIDLYLVSSAEAIHMMKYISLNPLMVTLESSDDEEEEGPQLQTKNATKKQQMAQATKVISWTYFFLKLCPNRSNKAL